MSQKFEIEATQLVDVASGVSYLHSRRLAHGDLKGVRQDESELTFD